MPRSGRGVLLPKQNSLEGDAAKRQRKTVVRNYKVQSTGIFVDNMSTKKIREVHRTVI
jgi:hypothetical protein